jgi:hypothetical protein
MLSLINQLGSSVGGAVCKDKVLCCRGSLLVGVEHAGATGVAGITLLRSSKSTKQLLQRHAVTARPAQKLNR